MALAVRRLHERLPGPTYVVSFGACSNTGGPYWDSYSVTKGVDQVVPVDVYVPGCPPRPEALLDGLRELAEVIREPGRRVNTSAAARLVSALAAGLVDAVAATEAFGDVHVDVAAGGLAARAPHGPRRRSGSPSSTGCRPTTTRRTASPWWRTWSADSPGDRVLVRTRLPAEAPRLATATGLWPGAAWHERETREMFGIDFDGHPALEPLLLQPGFEGRPLRKDFVLAVPGRQGLAGRQGPDGRPGSRRAAGRHLPPGVPTRLGGAVTLEPAGTPASTTLRRPGAAGSSPCSPTTARCACSAPGSARTGASTSSPTRRRCSPRPGVGHGRSTCSTASRSTSVCACTAGSASRSARSTRCSGRRPSTTPTRGLAELLHEQDRLGGWLDSVPAGTIPADPGVDRETDGSAVSVRAGADDRPTGSATDPPGSEGQDHRASQRSEDRRAAWLARRRRHASPATSSAGVDRAASSASGSPWR